MTTCDNFVSKDNNFTNFVNYTGIPWATFNNTSCQGLVTHGDGSLVTQSAPAKPGEGLVLYAVGLGQTSPPQQTGQPAPSAAPTVTPMLLDFDYRSNALATKPAPDAVAALYAGAAPGYVGLYQVNFIVPPVPAGTKTCQAWNAALTTNANIVYSNLTVSLGGSNSFDGIGICVAVP